MHPENKIISLDPLNTFMKIGVQSQVFTIVNDDNYYYPDLMRGMIVDGMYGQDIGKYTGWLSLDGSFCLLKLHLYWFRLEQTEIVDTEPWIRNPE